MKTGANRFQGYDTTQVADSKVVAILDGEKQIEQLSEGGQGSIILDQTPFYAEAGGQVGDVGKIVSTAAVLTVADTYSPIGGLIIHKVTVEKGSIKDRRPSCRYRRYRETRRDAAKSHGDASGPRGASRGAGNARKTGRFGRRAKCICDLILHIISQ